MGHIENDASKSSSIVVCIFITAVMFLPSCCLATLGGYAYRHRLMGGICEVHFRDKRSKVNRVDPHTHRQYGDLISLLSFFFQNKGNRLKNEGKISPALN
jgi:hypothetical protein